MIQNIEIPKEVPFMTLSDAVLFPQAIMPLFIFEPRYRKMLSDVLPSDRVFAVTTLDERNNETASKEMFYPVAGVGIIRACKKNPNGNLNLILQGIARVKVESVISESPYRKASIQPIISKPGGTNQQLVAMKNQIIRLIQTQRRLGVNIPKEIFLFLNSVDDPESMLDLSIYTLCNSTKMKLELLEKKNILSRFKQFALFLETEIRKLKLNLKLKGTLEDDDIGNN
jgi:ATP-dependent Lon protease